jgi:predicted ATPase
MAYIKIKRIKIHGFKSLKEIDFELRPLNVLIGPNNGGKTNFLDFFAFLSEAAHEQLQDAIARRGGFHSLVFAGYADPKNQKLFWEIQCETPIVENPRISYKTTLTSTLSFPPGTKVEEESLGGQDLGVRKRPFSDLEKILAGHKILEKPKLKEEELVIAQEPKELVEFMFRDYMRSWTIYEFSTAENSPLRREQSLKADIRISPTGDNLASVLHNLREQGQYREAYNEIIKTLKAAFPAFKDLHFPSGGGEGKIIIRWEEGFRRDFSANVLSDGVLKFLCLATLLLSSDPPDIICIDEPEIGLHPGLIGLVAEMLVAASEKTQLIVATHSPQLITHLKPEDVVVVERENGATVLKRLPAEQLQSWLRDFTLGELWLTGVIGGR